MAKAKTSKANLDPAELERWARQRQLQQQAVTLQEQQGKQYVSRKAIKKKQRKSLERRKFEDRTVVKKKDIAREKREKQKSLKRQKASAPAAPDVVVVPIFWKGEAGQRARVLSACVDAERVCAEAGLQAVLDGGTKYTPGQKFAHWEHKGVRLRVEIGPREAEASVCTVALTLEAGSVAKRFNGVHVEALPARLEALSEVTDEEGLAALGLGAGGELVGTAAEDDDDDAEPSGAAAAAAQGVSGDQLEDDFVEEEEEAKSAKKKASKKRSAPKRVQF